MTSPAMFRAHALAPPAPAGVLARVPASPHSGPLRRGLDALGDVGILIAVVLAIPFVILGVGIPVALLVQGLLWIGRLLWP